MAALASVAGTIICGGAIVVACCWQNRERGHLKNKKGGKYQPVGYLPSPCPAPYAVRLAIQPRLCTCAF